MGRQKFSALALIFTSLLLSRGISFGANGESNLPVRDAIGLGASSAYITQTGLSHGGDHHPNHDYHPPENPKAIEKAFWESMYRLERKQVTHGYQGGRQRLVDRIRRDLSSLPAGNRNAVMNQFLRISHHYHARENAKIASKDYQYHHGEFYSELESYANKAQHELVQNRNPVYQRLFADVRALAESGPDGLKLSRELARFAPSNPTVLTNLSQDELDSGNLEKAIDAGERSIEVDPTDPQPYRTVASAKYEKEDYPGAYNAANAALRRDPGDKIAYSIVKLAKSRLPELGGPEAPQYEDFLPGSFDKGRRPKRPAVSQFTALSPTEDAPVRSAVASRGPSMAAIQASNTLADQARTALRQRDYERAGQLATRSLEKYPGNVSALFRRALAYTRQDRLEEALADTTRALKLMGDKPSPVLLTLHSQVLNRLGRHEDALASASLALRIGPEQDADRARAYFQKAWALAGLDRRDESLRALGHAARLNRRYVPYYQEALELPEDGDLKLLFSSGPAKDLRPKSVNAPNAMDPRERTMMIVLFSLVGGLLVALGLLHVFGSRSTARRREEEARARRDHPTPSQGRVIGGTFKISRRIGEGGMGIVYEAEDIHLERTVAIKKMREEVGSDPRERERFLREARTVASLKHPNIVEIHSIVGDEADIYLVFEFVDGHTATDYIRGYGRIPFDQAVRITQGVGAALQYAHRRGVIHRDLKPSNIMISREGIVKVMDFGVARQAKESLSTLSNSGMDSNRISIAGTPSYMAPEAEQGHTRKESDVYAMAICFYEMLSGKAAFTGTAAGMSINKLRKRYVPISRMVKGLPEGIDQVLDWALDPDPDKRCATSQKFINALVDLSGVPRVDLPSPQ